MIYSYFTLSLVGYSLGIFDVFINMRIADENDRIKGIGSFY